MDAALTTVEITKAGLVDLDASFLFHLVVFVVTAVALHRIVFRPLLQVEQLRHEATLGAIAEARRLEQEAEQRVQRYEEAIGQARKQGLDQLAAIRRQAAEQRQRAEQQARQAADVEVARAVEQLRRAAEAAEAQLRTRADVLADRVVAKVLHPEEA